MIVVDASAVVEALLDSTPGLAERLFLGRTPPHAPHLIDVEVVSALRTLVRGGSVTASVADEVLRDFQNMRLERHPHAPLLPRAWELRHNLSPYDAAYVALAELLEAPLVTRDLRLANAPGHRARIEAL